jgi:hypothetical protein
VPELCIAYWDSLPNVTRPSNAPKSHSISSSRSSTPIPNISQEIKQEDDHNTTMEKSLKKKSSRKRELDEVDESKITKRVKQYVDHVPGYMIKLGYQFPIAWPEKTTNWEKELRKICVQASPVDPRTMLCYIEW